VPIPPFTATSPAPPQQHCARAFFEGVDGIQASAAVRLQAAARGLLARRRLQKMRLEMQEAALTAIDLGNWGRDLGKWGRDLAPSDGHQRSCQLAAVFTRMHISELQFYSSDRGGAFLFDIGGGTLPGAITFRHRPPRGRLRWSLSRLISGGRTCPPLSFRWSPWDPGGYLRAGPAQGGCPPYLQESKIKNYSLFKISRDVKGLFLSFRFASSGVIVSVIIRLQLEDELHVQVGCSVRGVKGLLGLSPLGLISRLLRGQVNLSI